MDHIEVADLGEKPSHSFSVVLAVSDGSGPAHKSDFNINAKKPNACPAYKHTSTLSLKRRLQPSVAAVSHLDTNSYTSAARTNGQVRVSKRLLGEYFQSVVPSSKANNHLFKSESLLVEAQISRFLL